MFKKDIAFIADLIGDSARPALLIALLGGKYLTAGELARHANVSPQTASSHLNKLIEGGLIVVEAQGKLGVTMTQTKSTSSCRIIRSVDSEPAFGKTLGSSS